MYVSPFRDDGRLARTCLVALLSLGLSAGPVLAQRPEAKSPKENAAEAPRPLHLVRLTVADDVPRAVADALMETVVARTTELQVADVRSTTQLDYADLQLAVGCAGEGDACLVSVAEQLGSELLLVPSLSSSGATWVLSVSLFDARDPEDVRREWVRAAGPDRAELVQRAVPALLRRLFELPVEEPVEAPVEAPTPRQAAEAGLAPAAPPPTVVLRRSPLPWLVLGSGLATVAGGVVFGLLAEKSERDYARAPVDNRRQVEAAQDELSSARNRATIANVCFALGGAAAVSGLLWALVRPLEGPEPVQLTPQVHAHGAGLALGAPIAWSGM